jgi:hypothetical protein
MKTLRLLAVSAVVLAASNVAMAADEKVVTDEGVSTFSFFKPFSVRLEGGNVGYGGAIVYGANQYTDVVFGYNGGDASEIIGGTIKYNGVKYDLEQDNNTPYINIEVHPFANWLHLAFGVAYMDNTYKIKQANSAGFIKINDNYFDASQTKVGGKVEYKNNIAPYLGIGVSPSITDRIGVFAQVGAYYNGNPKATLVNAGTNVTSQDGSTTINNELHDEQRNIEQDDKYKWLPVGKVGLSVRF